jgi:hypothetical protein
MIIGETKDLETLGKMRRSGILHFRRCINPFKVDDPEVPNSDFNPKKAAEIQVDLTAVELRIEELTNP